MAKISFKKSSGNVFADIGFTPAAAAELTAKSVLIIAVKDTVEQRQLTQQEAGAALRHRSADAFQSVPWPHGKRHHRPARELAQRAWTGRGDRRQIIPAHARSRPSARGRNRLMVAARGMRYLKAVGGVYS